MHLSLSSESGQFAPPASDARYREVALKNGKAVTRREGRREKRSPRTFEVLLAGGGQPMLTKAASTENVSSWACSSARDGFGSQMPIVFVKSSNRDFWTRARVVYCRTLQGAIHALGLEFYATAHTYNLTFRCIRCGRYEASANYRSDRIEFEDQIKARIYPVRCAGCGWKGEACGFSVIRILRYKSRETYKPDEDVLQLGPMHESSN